MIEKTHPPSSSWGDAHNVGQQQACMLKHAGNEYKESHRLYVFLTYYPIFSKIFSQSSLMIDVFAGIDSANTLPKLL